MFSRTQLRAVAFVAAAVCLPAIASAESTGIAWRTNLDAAKLEAAQSNRLMLLHFYTQTCGPCKLLDRNVLSLPQVGAAVEQDYVPVKIDADASPAVAHMFRIDRVPTEVVLTPGGNIVATLQTPDNPEAYTAQLSNLARHFRQTTPGASPESPAATVNSAYAGLTSQGGAAAAAQAEASQVGASQMNAPQVQNNPYVAAQRPTSQPQATSPPSRYGEAARYGELPPNQTTTAAGPTGAVAAPPVGAMAGATAASLAASGPTMPTNAMPQSYRSPLVNSTTPSFGAVGPGTANANPAATAAIGAAAGAAVGAAAANPAATTPPNSAASSAIASAAVPGAGAPPQGAAVRPASQPPLPAGSPPVAFDGCCPVTLKTQNRWALGSTAYGCIHRGRTYLFVGEQERQQFRADPDAYSPVFAGYDPVLLLEKQQSVPGSRKFGYRYGGAFYLFSSQESMDRFQASPQTYAAGVRQAMAHVDGTSGAVLRR